MAFNPMFSMQKLSMEEAKRMSKNWWIMLIAGLISVASGIIILNIEWTPLLLAYFVGAVLILRSFGIAFSPQAGRMSTVWSAFVGFLSFLAGAAVILFPTSLILVALIVGIWFILSGLFDITSSVSARHVVPYWWLVLTRGILVTGLGFFALYRPLLTLTLLIAVFGIWALVVGITEIALSFEIKGHPERLMTAVETEEEVSRPRRIA